MKYEMIFGDERLFDGAPEDAEVSCKTTPPCNVDFIYYKDFSKTGFFFFGSSKKWLHSESTPAYMFSAMRSIIKEPKRWTWEDKKAGRLPEVGAYVFFGKKGKNITRIAEFIGTGTIDSVWCLKLRCGSYVFVESEIVSPIETPAEKAQREEDEWVNKAWSETAVFAGVTQDEHDRLRIHLRHIYRAQLSGELAAPKGGE